MSANNKSLAADAVACCAKRVEIRSENQSRQAGATKAVREA
jgi:hypothetical protein